MSVNEKNPVGYFLEVELEYSNELHELHNDNPLAPEKLAVSSDMLSKYCKKIADKYEIKVRNVKKIIPNLGLKKIVIKKIAIKKIMIIEKGYDN